MISLALGYSLCEACFEELEKEIEEGERLLKQYEQAKSDCFQCG